MGSGSGKTFEIWAGFRPVGNTEKKKLGRLWATFEEDFFMFSNAKRLFFFWKCCSVRTEKFHRKKKKKYFFYGEKPPISPLLAPVVMLTYVIGWAKKSQKLADVLYGWSLKYIWIQTFRPANFTYVILPGYLILLNPPTLAFWPLNK